MSKPRPNYLIPRNGTYHFNRRVPAKLVPIIGRTFWRETLSTSDEIAAEKVATQRNADCEQEIAVALLEYRRQRSAIARLTPDERAVVEAAGGLKALRTATVGTGRKSFDTSLRTQVRFSEAIAVGLADDATMGRAVLAQGGIDRDDMPIDLDDVQDELAEAEARVATLRARLDRNLVILRKNTEEEADPELASDDPAKQAVAETLQTVLDRWARESKAPDQHVGQYAYAVKRFHELHGRVALPEINRAHLSRFKEFILKLPRSTRADLRNAKLPNAIAIADRENLSRITEKTAGKHVAALTTLLGHAVGWGFLDKSPADGLRFVKPRKKVSQSDERSGFAPAQLRALDESLGTEYTITDDERWLPILCAYQGCRQEEACQLLKTDVFQKPGGIWIMQITDADEAQKIKNRSSMRKLPIHQGLIDRGFLDHVKRSAGPRLFASLKPDQRGRLGGPYGKRFARHLHKRTKIVDPKLAFHSLRHSWVTAARNAELPEAIQKGILGHTQGGPVTSRYGDLADPSVLAPWLNKVRPFDDP